MGQKNVGFSLIIFENEITFFGFFGKTGSLVVIQLKKCGESGKIVVEEMKNPENILEIIGTMGNEWCAFSVFNCQRWNCFSSLTPVEPWCRLNHDFSLFLSVAQTSFDTHAQNPERSKIINRGE